MAEPALTVHKIDDNEDFDAERRRVERRTNSRLGDVTVPELRRMMVTSILFVIVLVLFLWMVRTVIIAGFLGAVVAFFLRPGYDRLATAIRHRGAAGIITILLLIGPLAAICAYSYGEIAEVSRYVEANRTEIAAQIDASARKLPFFDSWNLSQNIGRWVAQASNYGAEIPGVLRSAARRLSIALTIFLFTTFYVMVEWESLVRYIRSKVPPRYSTLGLALIGNVKGVLYGTVYSTFFTQGVKSIIILVMNLAFQVPLAVVLAMLSFVIGFFPIVGSWSIYLPVAAWLAVFQNAPGKAVAMIAIGFFVNTLYISTILRPRIAAHRSQVLNFYWMLVGLVTGVYTFGLVGIVLGPILIGLLKAILDTVTEASVSQFADVDGDAPENRASTGG
jgi:predicted PurR-regulated permease PerM